MKLLSVCLCIGILLTTLSAFADMDVEDFEQIRSIMREEIAASEARTKVQIDGLQTQIEMLFKLQLALMAFIAVVIGIPQIIVAAQKATRTRGENRGIASGTERAQTAMARRSLTWPPRGKNDVNRR